MKAFTATLLMAVLMSQANAAPQFITFKEGKIGVNFAGYHASAGLGGLLGGGTGGGLFAEAGTPYGQSARAGLGGGVDANGGSAGGLYAGATAGGNVKAEAGLGGGVTAEKSAGSGFASAQAGDHFASSGLGGESGVEGSSGFTFSGSKSFGLSKGVVKETEVLPLQPVEIVKPEHKKVYTSVSVDSQNEVKPLPLAPPSEVKTEVAADFSVRSEAQPAVLVKEVSKNWNHHGNYYRHKPSYFQDVMNSVYSVLSDQPARYSHRMWQKPQHVRYRFPEIYIQPPPQRVLHKEIIRTHYKPHRHHFRKTAYLGGYIGGDAAPPAPVVYKTVQPVIEKRIDIGAESAVDAGAGAHAGVGGGAQYGYTKNISYQRNPTFFADIFNIPISTLKAVGNFLGNTAGSTSVSVQKSASVHADSDLESSKHVPLSSATSSETHFSVQTPPVSKFIDDIFSIPINTLGAVNKFLENNVQGRKTVQVSNDGEEPTKVRLGHHARRRANKRVVIVQENPESKVTETEANPST